jgi:hypothetical protein
MCIEVCGTEHGTCVEIFTELPGDEKTSVAPKLTVILLKEVPSIYPFFLMVVSGRKVHRSSLGFSMNLFVLDFVAFLII